MSSRRARYVLTIGGYRTIGLSSTGVKVHVLTSLHPFPIILGKSCTGQNNDQQKGGSKSVFHVENER